MLKKATKALSVCLIFLFILEIALQLLSFINIKYFNKQMTDRSKLSSKNVDDDNRLKILCVGDSFTQGFGAQDKDHSYPMRLSNYLSDALGIPLSVYNCGVSATNSSEIVYFLPALLNQYSPNYVIVLIGVNDSWNFKHVEIESESNVIDFQKNGQMIPFRLRFRLLRLIKVFLKYCNDLKLSESYTLKNKEMPRISTSQINVNDHDVQIQLAFKMLSEKRINDALKKANLISREISDIRSPFHLNLAWIYIQVQEYQKAHSEINQYRKFFPNDPMVYEALSEISRAHCDYELSESYLKKLISAAPGYANSYRSLARLYISREGNYHEATRLIIKAYCLDKDSLNTEQHFAMINKMFSVSINSFKTILDDVKQKLKINNKDYKNLYSIYKGLLKKGDIEVILKKNLMKISNFCYEKNITPIFVTYPAYNNINTIIRSFCKNHNKILIDVEPVFLPFLNSEEYSKYFIPDTHLTNDGYKMLGEEIGRFLLEEVL